MPAKFNRLSINELSHTSLKDKENVHIIQQHAPYSYSDFNSFHVRPRPKPKATTDNTVEILTVPHPEWILVVLHQTPVLHQQRLFRVPGKTTVVHTSTKQLWTYTCEIINSFIGTTLLFDNWMPMNHKRGMNVQQGGKASHWSPGPQFNNFTIY